MKLKKPPLLGFCAYSGTGKTTLLSILIPILRKKGLRVGIIKHAHHHFDIDHPGKDSYELRKSGADEILISSSKRWALVHESNDNQLEPSLEKLLKKLSLKELDLILVEGFKHEPLPKIELNRPSLGHPFLYPNDSSIIAIAMDKRPARKIQLPVLDLNNGVQIVKFIEKNIL
tara:strand:- start:365 stop:883 length:519 start_codon:yes stop_codon:yes gene_type:complete